MKYTALFCTNTPGASELDNFTDTDISFLKREIESGIYHVKKNPVAPLNEIKSPMVDYIAIRSIKEELEMTF
ncbi:MAG: hypothetical protein MUC76_07065 [Spirochaetes bacterium]|nr:hypothetical protein [Spirochaetota bacterium]